MLLAHTERPNLSFKDNYRKEKLQHKTIPNFFEGFGVSATSASFDAPEASTSVAKTSTVATCGEVSLFGCEYG
jgi:hypothetical protein